MAGISILNDVIGPVMRGPSSSHTAASYHLAAAMRSLLGEEPAQARFTFDPGGSYAACYRQQGSDLAFAAGLLGWSITDPRFPEALRLAAAQGCSIDFAAEALPEADHPNAVRVRLTGRSGAGLTVLGRSIGGGAVEITSLEAWPVTWNAKSYLVAIEAAGPADPELARLMCTEAPGAAPAEWQTRPSQSFAWVERATPLPTDVRARLAAHPAVKRVWQGTPVFFVHRGAPLFQSAAEMIALARAEGLGAGQVALRHECQLLGMPEDEIVTEMIRRFEVMLRAVHEGLGPDPPPMQLLRPTAGRIYASEAAGRVALGGILTRAAARAMAAMHVNCAMGVVCAAPTAGSAGVLPGVLVTLHEEKGASQEQIARALLAAGAVGVVVAERATFAAEVAGCQVEIGAAGAMAAAAVADMAGATAEQAAHAAAIAFQNTMGSVCDLVQGIVEIPCHTRNAAAAASAFVCADLILGGYENPIGLDETIDAVHAVGKMLPSELRVTALGGLAATPSAKALTSKAVS
jgi:L-serine dehydratase